jgi:exodeoxyribonuclease VII small subunit
MSKKTADDSLEQPNFEAGLKRLEEIVHALEDGELGLNQSLEQYEEGVKLLRQSYDLLQKAERRIELLSGVDAEGNPVTQSFDDSATFDQREPGKARSRRRTSSSTPVERKETESLFGEEDVEE